MSDDTPQKCRFCPETGRHYVGGGQWLCFRHWLKLWMRRAS
jgi:hypothetical protein